MPKITVYAFRIYDPKQDTYNLAKGFCTEDLISTIDNAHIIKTKSLVIDDADLTQSGRYYPPDQQDK